MITTHPGMRHVPELGKEKPKGEGCWTKSIAREKERARYSEEDENLANSVPRLEAVHPQHQPPGGGGATALLASSAVRRRDAPRAVLGNTHTYTYQKYLLLS